MISNKYFTKNQNELTQQRNYVHMYYLDLWPKKQLFRIDIKKLKNIN